MLIPSDHSPVVNIILYLYIFSFALNLNNYSSLHQLQLSLKTTYL